MSDDLYRAAPSNMTPARKEAIDKLRGRAADVPTKADPIRIRCEGSGCPPNLRYGVSLGGMCSMCGQPVHLLDAHTVAEHERDDVIAMLHRGDFDE